MRKKISFLILPLIAFLGIFIAGIILFASDSKKYAHIYIDPASSSALFQMADFIKQPKSDPKYVAWIRSAHSYTDQFLTENNIFLSSAQNSTKATEFVDILKDEIQDFYRQNKKAQFIVHLNMRHVERNFDPIIPIIPRDQIKKIYMYEDSVGVLLWDFWTSMKKNEEIAAKYPVVFRISYKKEALKRHPQLNNYQLEEVNFHLLHQHLSESQKKMLYQLADFNEREMKLLVKDNNFVIFLDDPFMSVNAAFKHVDTILAENPNLKKLLWLYKQHPRESEPGIAYQYLKKRVDKLYVMAPKIPLEIMVISDFNPQYIGNGSSVFFSLKKEQILGYFERKLDIIGRKYDVYLPVLKSLNILDDSNTFLMPDKN